MTEHSLPLVIGKPHSHQIDENDWITSATFSRFTLPFAYQIEQINDERTEQTLVYEKQPLNSLTFTKCQRYFSRETALVLYKRALWLKICKDWANTHWGREEIEVTLKNGTFKIGMLPPEIILFEATPHSQDLAPLTTLAKRDAPNIMHTGFLSVDVYFSDSNKTPPQLDDLLVFNEFFRYSTIRDNQHATQLINYLGDVPLEYKTGSASVKRVKDAQSLHKIYFDRWANLLETPIYSQGKSFRLFSHSDATKAQAFANKLNNDEFGWHVYADNRTYTWTAAIIEKGGEQLQTQFSNSATPLHAKDYGHWLKLLNVDQPEFDLVEGRYKSALDTHQSISTFDRNWMDENTYKRWESNGTWYGFTYHSGAVLAAPKYYIFAPFHTYYFHSILMLFYIRISLFRFSDQLTEIVANTQESDSWKHDLKALKKKFSQLREQFATFTILYQFPLVSNQQQQIEMFELARDSLRVDKLFQEIQTEITSTHEFIELEVSAITNQAALTLSRWGIPLALAGVAAALFSIPDIQLFRCIQDGCCCDLTAFIQGAIVIGAALTGWIITRKK